MAFKAHLAVAFLLVTFFISDVKPNETSHQVCWDALHLLVVMVIQN